jgi:hypothetical protein
MDFQIVGLVFACIGVVASIIWFVLFRRGVRSADEAAQALKDIRDHLARQDEKAPE